MNFNEISTKYENSAVVQKSAGKILLELLDIKSNDVVLDLGCGTGRFSKIIREKTEEKIVAIDPSAGMIKQAKEKYSDAGIFFRNCSAEEVDYKDEFNKIFCNSAFQWFKNHNRALLASYSALKRKGKIGIQAPAKENYCPNFLIAIDSVRKNKFTKNLFSKFKSPWFFLNTSEEYEKLFKKAGFLIVKSWIEKVVSYHSPEEVYRIFHSGAAAGYLNSIYYSCSLTDDYVDTFKKIVRESFENQKDSSGKVELVFYRIFLIAIKP